MEMICHRNEKYGYFVGWRNFNPAWQPELGKATRAFRDYLLTHPTTSVKRELDILCLRKHYKDQLEIVHIK